MTPRQAVLLASTLLLFGLAATGSGQEVIDSVDVGAAWVCALAHNATEDVVYGVSCVSTGGVFALSCVTSQVVAYIPLFTPFDVVYNGSDNKVYCTFGPAGGGESLLVADGHSHSRIKAMPLADARVLKWDAGADRVYVSCGDGDLVHVIDCLTDSVIATIPCPGGPSGMDINTRHRKLYVRCWDGEAVAVIDMATNQVAKTVAVGGVPESGCYSPAVDKYYCGGGPSAVIVLDGATDTVVRRIDLPPSTGVLAVAYAGNSNRVFIGGFSGHSDSVFVIDAASDSLVNRVPVGRVPASMAWSVSTDLMYCLTGAPCGVAVLAGDGSRLLGRLLFGTAPFVILPVGVHRRMYVGDLSSNMIYIIRDSASGIEEDGRTIHAAARGTRVQPCPFSCLVTVEWYQDDLCDAGVNIYALSGVLVASLTSTRHRPDTQLAVWDGRDSEGRTVSAGVYTIVPRGNPAGRVKVVKVN